MKQILQTVVYCHRTGQQVWNCSCNFITISLLFLTAVRLGFFGFECNFGWLWDYIKVPHKMTFHGFGDTNILNPSLIISFHINSWPRLMLKNTVYTVHLSICDVGDGLHLSPSLPPTFFFSSTCNFSRSPVLMWAWLLCQHIYQDAVI